MLPPIYIKRKKTEPQQSLTNHNNPLEPHEQYDATTLYCTALLNFSTKHIIYGGKHHVDG